MMRILALLVAVLLGSGCVSATWVRESRYAPPDPTAVTVLEPGESGLDHCLAALGAPLWVWEYGGDGVALAYGWLETEHWQVDASIPVSEFYSASFDYTDVDSTMQGLVLLLDADLVLQDLRRGLLRDLTREAGRVRPASPATDQP